MEELYYTGRFATTYTNIQNRGGGLCKGHWSRNVSPYTYTMPFPIRLHKSESICHSSFTLIRANVAGPGASCNNMYINYRCVIIAHLFV